MDSLPIPDVYVLPYEVRPVSARPRGAYGLHDAWVTLPDERRVWGGGWTEQEALRIARRRAERVLRGQEVLT